MFYRNDKFKLLESGTFWLSETPDAEASKSWGSACNRIASWIVVARHGADNVKTLLLSTHFDHVSNLSRSQSSKLVVQKVSDLSKWFNCSSAVVMGDFNTTPQLEPECGKPFVNSPLRDAFAGAPDKCKEIGTFHNFTGKPELGIGRIDWIWIAGFAKPKAAGIYTQKKGKFYASDHFPVFCDLVLWE